MRINKWLSCLLECGEEDGADCGWLLLLLPLTTASAYEHGREEDEDIGVGIFYQIIKNMTMSASSFFYEIMDLDLIRQLNNHGFDSAVE